MFLYEITPGGVSHREMKFLGEDESIMVNFSQNGFKFEYPDNLKLKGSLMPPYLGVKLINKKTKGELRFTLWTDSSDFETLYESNYDPNAPQIKNDELVTIVRAGDYSRYLGAKELYSQHQAGFGVELFFYYWNIIIPLGSKTLEICALSEKSDQEIKDVWQPIIESLQIDPSHVSSITDSKPVMMGKTVEWNKSGLLKKIHHFQYLLHPDYSMISVYDSEAEYVPETEFGEQLMSQRLMIKNHEAIVAVDDALDIIGDFYYGEKIPEQVGKEQLWKHIVEGSISIDSGKVSVNACGIPEIQVNVAKGKYRLRVCLGEINHEINAQNCCFYFRKINENINHDITIIKQGY